MNIEEKINESKRRTKIMNGITIDWQYAQQILPVVLPIMAKEQKIEKNEEFNKLCNTLYVLFDNIKDNISELTAMLPADYNKTLDN